MKTFNENFTFTDAPISTMKKLEECQIWQNVNQMILLWMKQLIYRSNFTKIKGMAFELVITYNFTKIFEYFINRFILRFVFVYLTQTMASIVLCWRFQPCLQGQFWRWMSAASANLMIAFQPCFELDFLIYLEFYPFFKCFWIFNL